MKQSLYLVLHVFMHRLTKNLFVLKINELHEFLNPKNIFVLTDNDNLPSPFLFHFCFMFVLFFVFLVNFIRDISSC